MYSKNHEEIRRLGKTRFPAKSIVRIWPACSKADRNSAASETVHLLLKRPSSGRQEGKTQSINFLGREGIGTGWSYGRKEPGFSQTTKGGFIIARDELAKKRRRAGKKNPDCSRTGGTTSAKKGKKTYSNHVNKKKE